MPESIFLIGPMGAGKTTIGRQLAKILNMRFVDCDQAIEERTGVKIPVIFEIEGEAGFRKRESAMLSELTAQPNIVLATGGGVILSEDNRRLLRSRGHVVYLQTSVDTQLERTRNSRNRPLLDTEDRRARLEEIMQLRAPLYRLEADQIIDTEGRSPTKAAQVIAEKIEAK
ncbi:MAG: shikimate kinase AroK [Gammaproteobacteria bacterium]|nr:shikimate kinase AroK [Gammaproteobacteria bacterium]